MMSNRILAIILVILSPAILPVYAFSQEMEIAYSTYLGGSAWDRAHGIAAGSGGGVYVCGHTDSSDFPTGYSFQGLSGGNRDAFIAALDSAGSSLVFGSYLGGTGKDQAVAVAVDGDGQVYCSGFTQSVNFPTLNPYQAARSGSQDGFLAKISSAGDAVLYSSYLGGSGVDDARGLDVGVSGAAVLVGSTTSEDFPTRNPFQGSRGGGSTNAFVSMFTTAGSDLLCSTYLGGSGTDYASSVKFGTGGDIFLAGWAGSTDFPIHNAYQSTLAGNSGDAFLSRISSDGASLSYSTYLGGSDSDYASSLALDSSGYIHMTGISWSQDFPTWNSFQSYKASGAYNYDAIAVRFLPDGSGPVYSTYLGGSDRDYAYGIGVGSGGATWIAGATFSFDFPVSSPYQESHAGSHYTDDGFVSVISSAGALLASTYLGGSVDDSLYALALDTEGNAYIAGGTASDDFPTLSPYQPSLAGSVDPFVCKFYPLDWTTSSPSPSPSPTASPTSTPSPSATPSPTPTSSPSPTATPSPSSTPSPSPSPTIRKCFSVEGRISEKGGAQAIAGALVRIAVPDGRSSVVLADGDGNYAASVCTHIPDGQLLVQARHRDYLPFQAESSYAEWSAPGRHDVSLGRAAKLQGMAGGDYDGDGTADLAVYRPGLGFWAVHNLTRAYWGIEKDEPCPGDYDGDGTAEMGVFRAGTALWAIRDLTRAYFGDFVDLPVPADYAGEGTAGIAVFRSTSGLWAVRGGTREVFGIPDDQPVPGRYTTSGGASPAIYRSQSGYWSVRGISIWYFGLAGDRVVPGDYDGEGYWRPAVQRPGSGLWAVWGGGRWTMESGPSLRVLPADYNGDGLDEAATFLDSSGRWRIRELTTIYFGKTGDLPAVR